MGLHGVQVVGGSNPPCPTNLTPNSPNNLGEPTKSHGSRKSNCERRCALGAAPLVTFPRRSQQRPWSTRSSGASPLRTEKEIRRAVRGKGDSSFAASAVSSLYVPPHCFVHEWDVVVLAGAWHRNAALYLLLLRTGRVVGHGRARRGRTWVCGRYEDAPERKYGEWRFSSATVA